MTQTRRGSLIEATTNTFIGMVLSFAISQAAHVYSGWIQIHIWSGFVWELSATSNIIMTVVLTAVSVLRSYIMRRSFNARLAREEKEFYKTIHETSWVESQETQLPDPDDCDHSSLEEGEMRKCWKCHTLF